MNPYISGLVLKDLKNYRNIASVKDHDDSNTWIIYDTNSHANAMIFFKNYLFEVTTFQDDKKIIHDKYLLLSDAIEHMDKLNKK